MDKDVRELADMSTMAAKERAILLKLQEEIDEDKIDDLNLEEKVRSTFEMLQEQYSLKTTRQRYADNEMYAQFRQIVWDAGYLHADEPMPNLKELLPAEARDVAEEDDDDDLQMGGVNVSFKCPLTQTLLEKPVKK